MFVTEALRSQVGPCLDTVDECAAWLRRASEQEVDWATNQTKRLAGERALHVAIESVTDAGNFVIDALIMREPGSYADIVRVLMEEGVVTRAWFQHFEAALTFRNRIVHEYRGITPQEVAAAVANFTPLFSEFVQAVRAYLEME